MDDYKMEQYLAKVPDEIRDAVMSLSNNKQWAIYIALAREGKMRFNEIKEQFGSDQSPEIDRALKALIKGGLVEKVAHGPEEIKNAHTSHYAVSVMGIRFLGCLGDLLSPAPRRGAAPHLSDREKIPNVMGRGKSIRYRRRFEQDTARNERTK